MKKVGTLENTSKQQVYDKVYEDVRFKKLDNDVYDLLEKYNNIEIKPNNSN